MNAKPLSRTWESLGWLPFFLLTTLICAHALTDSVLYWKQDEFVILKGN